MTATANGGQRRTVRIGLTGPIGCGKSTVAAWLGEHPGVVVLDADLVARDVLTPGTPELDAVYRRFGAGLRRDDGTLDRTALGRVVFADPAALADLEAIVHQAVRPRILAVFGQADADRAPAVVVEAIKLVEGGLAELCDEVWLVTCDRAVQEERLAIRGMTASDAAARIDAQASLADRVRPRATRVIETSGQAAATKTAVETAFRAALADAGDAGPVSPRA